MTEERIAKVSEGVLSTLAKLDNDSQMLSLIAAALREANRSGADELRQPIEDKSVCQVGHMKVNLVYEDTSDPDKKGIYIEDGYCLTCQDITPLRESLEQMLSQYHSLHENMSGTGRLSDNCADPNCFKARQALERNRKRI